MFKQQNAGIVDISFACLSPGISFAGLYLKIRCLTWGQNLSVNFIELFGLFNLTEVTKKPTYRKGHTVHIYVYIKLTSLHHIAIKIQLHDFYLHEWILSAQKINWLSFFFFFFFFFFFLSSTAGLLKLCMHQVNSLRSSVVTKYNFHSHPNKVNKYEIKQHSLFTSLRQFTWEKN